MNEIKRNIKIAISSEKNFGYTFSFIFFLVSVYAYFKSIKISLLFIFLTVFILVPTLFKPKLLKWPNLIWNKFGFFLGNVLSYIVMFVIFFSIGTLTSIFLKFFKKDSLNLNFDKKIKSYWESRKKQTSLRDQY